MNSSGVFLCSLGGHYSTSLYLLSSILLSANLPKVLISFNRQQLLSEIVCNRVHNERSVKIQCSRWTRVAPKLGLLGLLLAPRQPEISFKFKQKCARSVWRLVQFSNPFIEVIRVHLKLFKHAKYEKRVHKKNTFASTGAGFTLLGSSRSSSNT